MQLCNVIIHSLYREKSVSSVPNMGCPIRAVGVSGSSTDLENGEICCLEAHKRQEIHLL